MRPMAWKTRSSETLIKTRWVTVRKDAVEIKEGVEIEDFYLVTIPDAAAVVALTDEGKVLLKREYRYSCGEELIELPAGSFEPEESDPLAVAKRELLEETGYSSQTWTYLGSMAESTSKLTNHMHIFLAEHCRKTGEPHPDTTEFLEVIEVPFETAIDMVMRNELKDNTSAAGILKAARLLGK